MPEVFDFWYLLDIMSFLELRGEGRPIIIVLIFPQENAVKFSNVKIL